MASQILREPSSHVNDGEDSAAHLADIIAQATLKYSVKDYDAAAELYSRATELQAEINGEMSPDNAELLYAYGRCLYHVAVKNSDVLGSKVAGVDQAQSKDPRKQKQKEKPVAEELSGHEKRAAEETVAKVVEEKDGLVKSSTGSEEGNKPYFQFTGDENWDTLEDEADDEGQDADDDAEDEQEDDLVNAYEVLDLARVLLLKKIEEPAGKGMHNTRHFEERLADTYDLQAEISLEGERFSNAVTDLTSALQLKAALFPQESSILAEAHYKLSLALEFSSVTVHKDGAEDSGPGKEAMVDEEMRELAAKEMEAAIASCKLRMQKEEDALVNRASANGSTEKSKVTKANIEDVKEMVREMEQRLIELRQSPVSVNDPAGTGTLDSSNLLSSVLGSIVGETPSTQKARLEEASKDATDVTNLIKRKRMAENESPRSIQNDAQSIDHRQKINPSEEWQDNSGVKRLKASNGDD
ncbi:hypothetical protein ACLMJK_008087 [Lecanora helva]